MYIYQAQYILVHATKVLANDVYYTTCSRSSHDSHLPRRIHTSPNIDHDARNPHDPIHTYSNMDMLVECNPICRDSQADPSTDPHYHYSQALL